MVAMSDEFDWRLFAWAIDFVRGVEEFPKWRRWILRFVLGKYIAREYVGLREHLRDSGNYVDIGYGLERTNYHKEKWSWIRE